MSLKDVSWPGRTYTDLLSMTNLSQHLLAAALLLGCPLTGMASTAPLPGDTLRACRPTTRTFRSEAVERAIADAAARITHPYLRQMFINCYPNTLDTTIDYRQLEDGDDDTFVITGDIPAMWLRDASAQVKPYLRFAREDEHLRHMLRGVVRRALRCLLIDPYANAFCQSPDSMSWAWSKDYTKMLPGVYERKYELDSQCYPLLLLCDYIDATADATVADHLLAPALDEVLTTMEQQADGSGWRTYKFARTTHALHDTRSNYGLGHPGRSCGLIASAFRPSDDSNVLPFNIPGNMMAAHALKRMAGLLRTTWHDEARAARCLRLAEGIERGLRKWGTVRHPEYGCIYAYEVDARGSALLMDDANVPSLLSLPYIAGIDPKDKTYVRTRRFILSEANPYFFAGRAGQGIGGPHVGMDYVWPMSTIMQALTGRDDREIAECLTRLMRTDAGTMFMHEAYHKDDDRKFTRHWFAWANTLFGELILHLLDEGKDDLINSLPEK